MQCGLRCVSGKLAAQLCCLHLLHEFFVTSGESEVLVDKLVSKDRTEKYCKAVKPSTQPKSFHIVSERLSKVEPIEGFATHIPSKRSKSKHGDKMKPDYSHRSR